MPGPERFIPVLPVSPVLSRRLTVSPGALRTLHALRRQTPIPPAALGRGQQRAKALIAALRQRGRAGSASRMQLGKWDARRTLLGTRLVAVVAKHPQRSPEQVLTDLTVLVRRQPANARRAGAAASVVVRSTASTGTITGLLGDGGAIRALAGLGLAIHRLRDNGDPVPRYVVRLPISAGVLGREIQNVAWAIRQLADVEDAYPDRHDVRMFFRDGVSAQVAPADVAWHVGMTKADRAHAMPPGSPRGKAQGEGSVIAHPDSGWANHPQYNVDHIDVARSYNTATNRSGGTAAQHALRGTPGSSFTLTHGTGTGCVMVGGTDAWPAETGLTRAQRAVGDKKPTATAGRLVGIAPQAKVLPIKFLSDDLVEVDQRGVTGAGVIRLGDGDFVEAIRHAVALGADVMSLSVGGFVSANVADEFAKAIHESDLIVVAAAGQTYLDNLATHLDPLDSVIEPARFRDVIAVAGCSTDGERWSESHRGPNVDITAPCDAIWVADFDPDHLDDDGTARPIIRAASGTSFAAAIVAGAAAVWVAHWGGRAVLKQTYPDKPLAWVFRELLQRSAARIPGKAWDEIHFGPGILDVEALLNTPLPPQADIPEPPASVGNLLEDIEAGVGVAGALLDVIVDGAIRAAAGAMLLAGALAAVVDDLGRQLAFGYAALEDAVGDVADGIAAAVADGEQLLRDTAAAAQEAAEAAADVADDAVDALAGAAEEAVEAGGEAVEEILSWFPF